jgi:hypothetical protein
MFAGFMELLAAVLLLFPRLATLGALAAIGVLTNVVTLNYTYDVPVKIYSTQLLLTAIVLVSPDALRLFRLFVLRTTEQLRDGAPHLSGVWQKRAAIGVQLVLALAAIYNGIQNTGFPKHPVLPDIAGAYRIVNSPGLTTIAFTGKEFAIDSVTDPRAIYDFKLNKDGTLTVKQYRMPVELGRLTYVLKGDKLDLRGAISGRPIHISAIRMDVPKGALANGAFHWINEMPNRH